MLSLDSPSWSDLRHAYGNADDIPILLRDLQTLPSSVGREDPWFTLWSSLAHQGDVYSASFAAVPHVVAALASDPTEAGSVYFHFPAWVEICRSNADLDIPAELAPAYYEALARLPALVSLASVRPWEDDFLLSALSAIAAAKGRPKIAEAILELDAETAEEFMSWIFSR
jgi:hypothetical protein